MLFIAQWVEYRSDIAESAGSNPDFFVLFCFVLFCCLFVCFCFLFFMLLVTVVLIGDFTAKILSLFIDSVTFERKMTVVILCSCSCKLLSIVETPHSLVFTSRLQDYPVYQVDMVALVAVSNGLVLLLIVNTSQTFRQNTSVQLINL